VKEWNYSAFHVKKLFCEACNRNFEAYFKRGKLSHTIPRTLKPDGELRVSLEKRRIIEFLKKHSKSTTDEIAEALSLPIINVLNLLIELQSEGSVQTIDSK
jgi:predicted Rossmann fold nucleotide-binding protein DprA/Smf involved in DNA uptake